MHAASHAAHGASMQRCTAPCTFLPSTGGCQMRQLHRMAGWRACLSGMLARRLPHTGWHQLAPKFNNPSRTCVSMSSTRTGCPSTPAGGSHSTRGSTPGGSTTAGSAAAAAAVGAAPKGSSRVGRGSLGGACGGWQLGGAQGVAGHGKWAGYLLCRVNGRQASTHVWRHPAAPLQFRKLMCCWTQKIQTLQNSGQATCQTNPPCHAQP